MLEDDRLNRVLANTDKMVAALPALMVASDPFQSVSSLSNAEGRTTAYDFKSRLLLYYFNQLCPKLPPGLAEGQPLPSFRMQCMISKLWLDSKIVEAAHIVPKATNSSRVSFVLTWKLKQRDVCRSLYLQWGDCVLGIDNVWDERNGLLWAEPFEKVNQEASQQNVQWVAICCVPVLLQAYHAHEIAVMYQSSSGTFKFRVLTDKLMSKRLSDYGKSQDAK